MNNYNCKINDILIEKENFFRGKNKNETFFVTRDTNAMKWKWKRKFNIV